MAKDTVDDSWALDAWSYQRGGWLHEGTLGVSRWLHNEEVVRVLDFEVQPDGLRLRYWHTSYWSDETTRLDYILPLMWTPAAVGQKRAWFRCPRCATKVRKVYLPRGAYRFACRQCHDLAYASQHRSRTYRALDRIFTLADRLSNPHMSIAKQIELGLRWDAAMEASPLGRWERESERRRAQLTRRPRPPGRPSKQQLREEARAEREARKAAQPPPRPRGRPKTTREYVRRQPTPDLSAFTAERQAYCVRCRDRRDLKWPRHTTLANGRSAIRGRCAECRTRILRLTASKVEEQ